MSLGTLLLGIFFVLLGITWLGWVAIGLHFLGALAAITGLVLLLEASLHPFVVYKHPQ